MHGWSELINLLILLGGALLLGTIAEQLRQSAIIGYLVAGMIVGPNVLGWVGTLGEAQLITEMGAALLLFSIGLEFSFSRLIRLGWSTIAVGALQIGLTWAACGAAALFFGLPVKAALVVGAAVSLSSTASVFRLLSDKTMMDSLHGRVSTGVLLLQDAAVVPIVLLITALGGTGGAGAVLSQLGKAVLTSVAAFAVLFVLLNRIVPRALNLRTWTKNREMPILLAIVIAVGSALGAHLAGISPAFGAFLAGMLLAESPFATQIRADVGSVRALMVTLFFAAVGMYADPGWIKDNILLVIAVSALVIAAKTLIVALIMLVFRFSAGVAVPTGFCLSQIGEFSFVLANIAIAAGLLGEGEFRLIVSATVLTLLLTPYLVGASPRAGAFIDGLKNGRAAKRLSGGGGTECAPDAGENIIVAGFGPAGIGAVDNLRKKRAERITVIDINPKNAAAAKARGADFIIGDAGSVEILEHAGVRCAKAVVVTLPDPEVSRRIILLCRDISPGLRVVARSRYNIYAGDILDAGAAAVVNEEQRVGDMLAEETCAVLNAQSPFSPAE